MQPYYEAGGITIYHGDCREVLPALPVDSVSLLLTDPPYYRVKGEWWDRQWDTATGFLAWLGTLADEWRRVVRANGSVYCFASPDMAARVECLLRERFNVLNRIRWVKAQGWHKKARVEDLRAFLSPWEEIIFAEHYGADTVAKGESGWGPQCDQLRGFIFEPLRAYLDGERRRAGIGKDDCNVACGFAAQGGMASRKYFSRSQWCLPTEAHYRALRALFNRQGGDYLRREYDYLRREYEDLRREYEDLRREYEDLRREYEDLRRPFAATAGPAEDVWHFPTVAPYPGKHPCEKPLPLLTHAIGVSSRPGALVLDCCMGTGATLLAAQMTGRHAIGVEVTERYCEIAARRLEQARQQPLPLEMGA